MKTRLTLLQCWLTFRRSIKTCLRYQQCLFAVNDACVQFRAPDVASAALSYDGPGAVAKKTAKEFCGRAWLFGRVSAWLQAPASNPVYVIYGGPGVGKSAVIAHLFKKPELLPCSRMLAGHICSISDKASIEADQFIASLFYQMKASLPEFQAIVESRTAHGERVRQCFAERRQYPLAALVCSILKPLTYAIANNAHKADGKMPTAFHVLVDSLDEAVFGLSPHQVAASIPTLLHEAILECQAD